MRTNNHTIVDLKKVAYANCFYRNQHANVFRRVLPKQPSANGSLFNPDEYAATHSDYPKETMMERARRLDILDKWLFVCKLQLSNGHTLEYTGEKGKSIWRAWNEKIFKGASN